MTLGSESRLLSRNRQAFDRATKRPQTIAKQLAIACGRGQDLQRRRSAKELFLVRCFSRQLNFAVSDTVPEVNHESDHEPHDQS